MRAWITAAAIGLMTSAALAELCNKCKDNMYTADIGKCQTCKEDATTSGSHKLCPACSKKAGECEHCRAKLKAEKPAESQPKK